VKVGDLVSYRTHLVNKEFQGKFFVVLATKEHNGFHTAKIIRIDGSDCFIAPVLHLTVIQKAKGGLNELQCE